MRFSFFSVFKFLIDIHISFIHLRLVAICFDLNLRYLDFPPHFVFRRVNWTKEAASVFKSISNAFFLFYHAI